MAELGHWTHNSGLSLSSDGLNKQQDNLRIGESIINKHLDGGSKIYIHCGDLSLSHVYIRDIQIRMPPHVHQMCKNRSPMSSSKGHSNCKYSSTFKLNHVYVHKIFSCGDDLRVNKGQTIRSVL